MTSSSSSSGSEILLYKTDDGRLRIDVQMEDETVWLSQKRMAELFEVTVPTVNEHLRNIFETDELDENSVIRNFRITAGDSKTYDTMHYNLDAIIALGYRVNSMRATQFRIWATQHLKEYIIKGFTMDDERLKHPGAPFGEDYFEELLERIRAIRASERRMYQKITDIFAQCSIDYNAHSPITRLFYSTVQNMLHFAITGQTAAEIIAKSADAAKPHMGLHTWKHSPKGKILKSDVLVAKNYLSEEKIIKLERLVSMYFDYIEGLIEKRTTFTMHQLSESIKRFLEFNEYRILGDGGSVTAEHARTIASSAYHKFVKKQDAEYVSDFDQVVQQLQSSSDHRTDSSI